ncbi:hypothetical protein [Micromonospora sp. S4605]|nr:hypothetical protein [Micromonospora sp. S4605]
MAQPAGMDGRGDRPPHEVPQIGRDSIEDAMAALDWTVIYMWQ